MRYSISTFAGDIVGYFIYDQRGIQFQKDLNWTEMDLIFSKL